MDTSDTLILFVVAMNALFGVIGTGITAYANRGKTSAEAEQIKAAATTSMTSAITTLVGQVERMTVSLDKRDERLDTLEREARQKDARIEALEAQVQALSATNGEKDASIQKLESQMEMLHQSGENKDQRIMRLQDQVKHLETERQKDQLRQEQIETERLELKVEVDRLREKLEAKNGGKAAESEAKTDTPAGGDPVEEVISHSDKENPAKPA